MLLRGALFAGRLFAGRLFGQPQSGAKSAWNRWAYNPAWSQWRDYPSARDRDRKVVPDPDARARIRRLRPAAPEQATNQVLDTAVPRYAPLPELAAASEAAIESAQRAVRKALAVPRWSQGQDDEDVLMLLALMD
jgi:hypothetical protein